MHAPSAYPCHRQKRFVTRRDFLRELGGGLGGVAFAGLSHIDSWDYKPELSRRNGQPFDSDGKLQFFASKPGNCQGSWWPFRQHGECGRWMSDLFPKLAERVDDLAFIHSMQSKSALHGPAMFMANSGFILPGFPSMGAWVTYGLGSENENLPGFVVVCPVNVFQGAQLWASSFLPSSYQGTLDRDPARPIGNLRRKSPEPAVGREAMLDDAVEDREVDVAAAE